MFSISTVGFSPLVLSSATSKLPAALMSSQILQFSRLIFFIIAFGENLAPCKSVVSLFLHPVQRVFSHLESALGSLAFDNLDKFLLRHFLSLRFLFLQFSLLACVYSRNSKAICEYTIP